ncbi:hypothetical protein CRENBAI_020793 [Crenichthys baileyi]|uniref:Uncharacterized protein n=1 Tax=Crenichthys baileyi TaxID=28760 RepID=A0AAV9QS65_9TELE
MDRTIAQPHTATSFTLYNLPVVSSQDARLILALDAELLSKEAKEAVGVYLGLTEDEQGPSHSAPSRGSGLSLSLLLTHPQPVWPQADTQTAAGNQPGRGHRSGCFFRAVSCHPGWTSAL